MADRCRRVLSLAALSCVAACSGGSDAPASPAAGAEFSRHLRLGVEQMRRQLLESARAELAKCERIDARDPELLFHRARWEVAAAEGTSGFPPAIELLERLIEADPDNVGAHRLLFALHSELGDRPAAARDRSEVERIYGPIGRLEMETYARYLGGEKNPGLQLSPSLFATSPDYRDLDLALRRLQRRGEYAPSEAIPVLERLMRDYPDLAAVRLVYARMLMSSEVRVDFSTRADLPPMSSRLIADYAQVQFERVLDLSLDRTQPADDARFGLADIGIRMADYDEAALYHELLLAAPSAEGERRRLQGLQGLTRYKQGRYGEAIELFHAALEGETPGRASYLEHLWLLHLAYEDAGIPAADRRFPFRFRPDLALRGAPTALDFEDIAARLNIDKLDGLGPNAWGDVDQDGDFDLFVSGQDSYGVLYRNDGDRFEDVSLEWGLFRAQSGFSATLVDYDNDGFPDLYIGRDGWNGPSRNSLYHNEGGGSFTEVTDRAGLGDPGSSFVHAWTDYDRDGDLDLYVANGITGAGDTNALYRNEGDGTFSDITAAAGLAEAPGRGTIGVAVGDYDKDGWPDIFVSGYKTLNRLYHNRGDGTFEEVAAPAGVAGADRLTTGYVAFFMDYDNDTLPDILRTDLAPWAEVLIGLSEHFEQLPAKERARLIRSSTTLYRNQGDGTFRDVSVDAGFIHPIGTMGANVADLDNDGHVDIYFGTGNPRIARMEPDRFYRNQGDGTFRDLTFAAGLGNLGKGHGVTFIDWDGDGDLEIYAAEGGFWHGDPWRNAFYLNRQETGNHWLHVDLEGVRSNRDAVGARLTLRAGTLRVYREVSGGRGFGSSDSPTVEFGLGRATTIDELEIVWPGGATQSFSDIPVDTRISIREGERWRPRDGLLN